MASRTQIVHISDLSGEDLGDGGETIDFSYRGVHYSIDLSEQEAKGFDNAIGMYVEHAQRKRPGVAGRQGISNMRRHRPEGGREQLQAAREWLRDHGYQVSDRGRIKSELMDVYNKQH